MLPLAYQTPAAIVLLVGGLLACFAGYRLFKLVLGIYGFILGAAMTSTAIGSAEPWWMILAAIGGGLVGALILVAAYFIGVALLGAGLAVLAVHLVWTPIGGEPHPVVLIVAAVAGAMGALVLQRHVIIVGTAFAGAWTAIVGGLAMRTNAAKVAEEVWLAYPTSLDQHRAWIVAGWVALGVLGVVVQFKWTGKGKRSSKKKAEKDK